MKYLSMLLLCVAFALPSSAQNKDAILGKWVNSTGEAHLEITKRSEKFFGKLVWIKDPKDEKGVMKTDFKNPNAALRKKPIVGLEILKDFVYDDGKWTDGNIYDPKSGKLYSCTMTLKSNGDLNMRGYIGVSLLGRTEVWKRVK